MARNDVFGFLIAAVEHYTRNGKWWPQLFLAMPDHLHALISFPADTPMEQIVRNWRRYTAKTTGIIWQDGVFDHRLRGNESFEEKAHYIRMNPVRARLASQPEDRPYVWPASVAPETAR